MTPWTMQEARTLRDLRAQGKPFDLIADVLGRSVPSVASATYRLGLPRIRETRRLWTTEEEAALREGMADGVRLSVIARTIGRSLQSVCGKAERIRKEG